MTLKYGGLNAMGVEWSGITTSWFFLKMSEEQAQIFIESPGIETSWSRSWEQLYCRVASPDDFPKLVPCLEIAYARYAG